MDNSFLILIIIFCCFSVSTATLLKDEEEVYLINKKHRITRRSTMKTLLEKFVNKDCKIMVKQAVMKVKIVEITDGAVLVLDKNKQKILNIDYISSVEEILPKQ